MRTQYIYINIYANNTYKTNCVLRIYIPQMHRLLGKKKEQPSTNQVLNETSSRLDSRINEIKQKIQTQDADLLQLRTQFQKTPPGSSKNSLKQRIMTLLQQKNMYIKQRDALSNNMFNIDQTRFSLENIKEVQNYTKVMGNVRNELKKELKKIDINKVEELQDDAQDLLELEQEIQDVLGTTFNTDVIDESEMMQELNALEEYDLQTEDTPAYLKDHTISSKDVNDTNETDKVSGVEKLTL